MSAESSRVAALRKIHAKKLAAFERELYILVP